jgi:LmbE family N-acetylglucosaminyl deacetylase
VTSPRFTVVSFHAHPDDETFLTGGTLAKAAAEGHRVVVVTATDGDRGLASASDGRGTDLAARRGRELEAAAEALGCSRVVRLGYRDSGLRTDPADPFAFANADSDEVAALLAGILKEESADVLTVYDALGGYGHPDHVQVHRAGTRAAALVGTPVVLEATLDGDLVRRVLRVLAMVRSPLRTAAPLGRADIYTPRDAITHRIDVTAHIDQKRSAMVAHGSQQRADGQVRILSRLLRLPAGAFRRVVGTEWFVEQGRHADGLQTDIFSSLRDRPQAGDCVRRATAPATELGRRDEHRHLR